MPGEGGCTGGQNRYIPLDLSYSYSDKKTAILSGFFLLLLKIMKFSGQFRILVTVVTLSYGKMLFRHVCVFFTKKIQVPIFPILMMYMVVYVST